MATNISIMRIRCCKCGYYDKIIKFILKIKMRTIIEKLMIGLLCFVAVNAYAGYELVCEGNQKHSSHRIVYVDCENRKEFVDKLGAAWMEIRKNSIGGSIENMCWEAYNQAKDMHPSISFKRISDSFFSRCNMGLSYVN